VEKFAENLAQLISGDGAAAADGAAAGDASTDGASAGQPAVTAEAAPGSTEPTTVVPVTSTASAPPAQQNDDSINLVRLVGPAILKRVIPVAVGATVLALLSWRLRQVFSRRGRGQKK